MGFNWIFSIRNRRSPKLKCNLQSSVVLNHFEYFVIYYFCHPCSALFDWHILNIMGMWVYGIHQQYRAPNQTILCLMHCTRISIYFSIVLIKAIAMDHVTVIRIRQTRSLRVTWIKYWILIECILFLVTLSLAMTNRIWTKTKMIPRHFWWNTHVSKLEYQLRQLLYVTWQVYNSDAAAHGSATDRRYSLTTIIISVRSWLWVRVYVRAMCGIHSAATTSNYNRHNNTVKHDLQ